MNKSDKQIIRRSLRICGRYDRVDPAYLIEKRDEIATTLPANLKDSIYFEIDTEFFEYDPETYYALFMFWDDIETDNEVAVRTAKEAESKALREERDRLEFERLQKKFSK